MRRNLVAALIAGSALLSVGPAGMSAADDTVPPAPLPAEAAAPLQRIIPPDIVPALGNVLAQSGSEKAGLFGLPDISAHGGDLLLAQNTAPAAPGGGQVAGIYPLDAFQSNYLLPQYRDTVVLGQGTLAPGIGPDADIPGTGRIAFLEAAARCTPPRPCGSLLARWHGLGPAGRGGRRDSARHSSACHSSACHQRPEPVTTPPAAPDRRARRRSGTGARLHLSVESTLLIKQFTSSPNPVWWRPPSTASGQERSVMLQRRSVRAAHRRQRRDRATFTRPGVDVQWSSPKFYVTHEKSIVWTARPRWSPPTT